MSDTPTDPSQAPRVLLVPVPGADAFQAGYLGLPGEHAALEGEIHVKGVAQGPPIRSASVFSTLCTPLRPPLRSRKGPFV
jgi:hypothetical protein